MTTSPATLQARSSLPKVWPGLIFVAIPFILIAAIPAPTPDTIEKVLLIRIRMVLLAEASVVLGWAFWLYLVYRLHKEIALSAGSYPISPSRAAVFHLIPLFNLYWVFAWARSLSNFAWEQRSILMSWKLPAIEFSGALFITQIFLIRPSGDFGAVAVYTVCLAVTYFTGMYIFKNAKRFLSAEPVGVPDPPSISTPAL